MKREDIEKAAKDYSIGKTYFFGETFSKKWMRTIMFYARVIAVKTS